MKEMLGEHWHEIGLRRTHDQGNNSRRLLGTRNIPSLQDTFQTQNKKGKGKVQKYCDMAALAIQFVVAAVLGDPTTLIAGVVGSLISK